MTNSGCVGSAVQLSFGGAEPVILELPAGSALTRAALRSAVANATGVAEGLLRVFYRGRQVVRPHAERNTAQGAEHCENEVLRLENGAKLMALGSTEELVRFATHSKPDPLVRPFEGTRRTSKYVARPASSRKQTSGLFGFGRIEELPQFPDASDARSLLEQLANDEGVAKVMVNHNYTVGTLREMYPEGKVGVDPVCVLGLNKNRGQEILLRLRTDDLAGFRPYWKIREVLFHELAHNTHSDHSPEFYALMKELQAEADHIDWRTRRGRTVGDPSTYSSGSFYQQIEEDRPFKFWESPERLGGNRAALPREAAAQAALARVSAGRSLKQNSDPKKVKDETLQQASPTETGRLVNTGVHSHGNAGGETDHGDEVGGKGLGKGKGQLDSECEQDLCDKTVQNKLHPHQNLATLEKESMPPQDEIKVAEPSQEVDNSAEPDYVDPQGATTGRLSKGKELLSALVGSEVTSRAQSETSLRTILLYLNNARWNPKEEHFRRINRNNAGFRRRVGQYPSAVEFLRLFGFRDGPNMTLQITGEDPALLWLGADLVETVLTTA